MLFETLSFCEPLNQFVLVSQRNMPGVRLRSSRLFESGRHGLARNRRTNRTCRRYWPPTLPMRWSVGR